MKTRMTRLWILLSYCVVALTARSRPGLLAAAKEDKDAIAKAYSYEKALGFRSLHGSLPGSSVSITDDRFPILYHSMKSVVRLDANTIWAIGASKPNITTMISNNGGYDWTINNFPFDFYEFVIEGENHIMYEGIKEYDSFQIQPTSNQTAWLPLRKAAFAKMDGSEILVTDDGGTTWDIVRYIPLSGYYWTLESLNSTEAWIAIEWGTNGVSIEATHDGGKTWETKLQLKEKEDNPKLYVVNQDIVWVLVSPYMFNYSGLNQYDVLVTADGGETWAQSGVTADSIQGFVAVDQNVAWLVDFEGNKIIRTTDGGKTWKTVLNVSDLGIRLDAEYDDDRGFDIQSVGYEDLLVRSEGNYTLETTDGGINWKLLQQNDPYQSLVTIPARGSGNITTYALGQDGHFATSTDGGNTFSKAFIPGSISNICEDAPLKVRDIIIRNFEAKIVPLEKGSMQQNSLGQIGALLEACWDAGLEPICFGHYAIELNEKNMSQIESEYSETLTSVDEFYIFPSANVDDFGSPYRRVQPLAKNCIQTTILRPDKTYILSVRPLTYTSRCYTGGCSQTSDGYGAKFSSSDLQYTAQIPVDQVYPEKECTNEVPPPPQAIRVNQMNEKDTELCWMRPNRTDICVDGYTLFLDSRNGTLCYRPWTGESNGGWCEADRLYKELPIVTPDIPKTESETCFILRDLAPDSEYRVTVKAHQNFVKCQEGLGCRYGDPASEGGIYTADDYNSIKIVFKTPSGSSGSS